MNYQVLARKWRPRSFTEVIGQEHVLRALVNALERQRLHHAYLFTGTRGVGKTTLARILARCLNCEQGVTAVPCGQCSACVEINEGRFVDLIEVDAASRTKVEDTRDLLDNVLYAPARGRYKIYLIDEVHMLSTHSFNALLKTLEEPPEHVKFLLATTDPQKLPVTVLSRCLQFNLKNLSAAQIMEHLQQVLTSEEVAFDEPSLWLLASAAAGSMRDALSLTDQAIAHGEGSLKEAEVAAMLGTVDRAHINQLMEALLAGDGAALIGQCQELAELAVDYVNLVDQLIALVHRIALAQTVPAAGSGNRADDHLVAAYAGRMEAEQVQLYYQLLILGRRDLPLAPDLQTGFEMLMLRLHAFALAPEERAGSKQGQTGLEQVKPEPAVKKSAAPVKGAETDRPGQIRVRSLAAGADEGPVQVGPQGAAPAVAVAGSQVVQEAATKPASAEDNHWVALFARLPLDGMMRAVCGHLALLRREGDHWIFCLDESAAGLFSDRHLDRLQQVLSEEAGHPIRISVEDASGPVETPAQYNERLRLEQLENARRTLLELPDIQRLIKEFDGTLVPGSIRIYED